MPDATQVLLVLLYLKYFIGLENALPPDGDLLVVHQEDVDRDHRFRSGGSALTLVRRGHRRRPRLHLSGEEEPVEGDAAGDAGVLKIRAWHRKYYINH